MKRYGNLWDKICDIENIKLAHKKASRGKKYYACVKKVNADLDTYLGKIQEMLKNKSYKVSPYKREILNDKGKERELFKLPYYPDRIIQWAVMLQIENIFNKTFAFPTCASIKGRGIERAYKLVKKYLRDEEGTKYCLKLDIKKFYPNIDKQILKDKLRTKFKDKHLLWLFDLLIDSYPAEKGVPIGSYLSQYFANFYLSDLDHDLKENEKIRYYVRYMDDIVILHDSKEFLHNLRLKIETKLTDIKLNLKENYQVFPTNSRGIDFVGFVFRHSHIRLRKSIAQNLKAKMRKMFKKDVLDFSDYCSVFSYLGFLNKAKTLGLEYKFVRQNLAKCKAFEKQLKCKS